MEKKTAKVDLKQYGMMIALIVIYVIFAILTKGVTLSPSNVNNLIMQNGYIVILAVGMLLCCLTGNVDLGVGSVMAMSGAAIGVVLIDLKMNMWVAILAALLVGLIAGVFVGFFVAVLDIPPFIVTLATMLMGRGLTYTILKAQTKGPFEKDFSYIGSGFLPTVKISFGDGQLDLICIIVAVVIAVLIVLSELKAAKTREKYNFAQYPFWQIAVKDAIIIFIIFFVFYKLGRNNGIPFQLLLLAVLVGAYHFMTTKTVAGRQIYAMGGNRKAAQLSGINTKKVFFWIYTNMGILAALAGVVLAARNAAATPKAGDGYEMDAIASCYIGGTAVAGGAGTIIGVVVGAFVMGVLNNGMSLYGFSTDLQKVVKGIVLLGAVTIDLVSKNRSK